PNEGTDLQFVHAEGSRRYSANDVAVALSQLLGRIVTAQAVPRLQWQENFERFLSESAEARRSAKWRRSERRR
ncbi:hypothetical protein AB9F39_35530, partial [Rhizobium leguminosarum]